MTLWSARRGAWVTCPGPGCEEALAESEASIRAMDRQPLPRGDWSGNPATWGRPHSHLGGDLPPFHPWLDFPIAERVRRWAMGDRPENYMRAGAFAQEHVVGAFFYDPDLAKFGNAFSPFVDLAAERSGWAPRSGCDEGMSYERAQRAMQMPFADRYGSRLDAPTWSDYMFGF